jgi:uncharacterized lipoprotein
MIKKVITCGVIILVLASCSSSDNSKKDPMRDWGTKKSTATPMKDLP